MKAKTKLFSLLLAVCLMLSVMPMAALADDEAPENIAAEDAIIDIDDNNANEQSEESNLIDEESAQETAETEATVTDETEITLVAQDSANEAAAYAEIGTVITVDGIKYEVVEEGKVKVTQDITQGNQTVYTASVTIPNTVSDGSVNYTVVGIDDYAFWNAKDLTSLTLPDTITSIGYAAFGYSGIQNLVIPKSVTELLPASFAYYDYTDSVTIAEGNTTYRIVDGVLCSQTEALYVMKEQETVNLPSGITTICEYCFQFDKTLKSIRFPEGLVTVGYGSFASCTALEEVILPESMTTLESKTADASSAAFSGCKALKKVSMPGVECIPASTFYGCSNLEIVILSDNLQSIGDNAFEKCSALKSIELPDGLTSIGDSAFWECSSLTKVELPDSLTSIGESAFYNCTGLENITIPENMTEISGGTFLGCVALTSITLPEGLTTIGDVAFALIDTDNMSNADPKLKYINIPSTVTSIGPLFLAGVKADTALVFEGEKLPTFVSDDEGGTAFSMISGEDMTSPTVYYPVSAKDAYTAENSALVTAGLLVADDTTYGYGLELSDTSLTEKGTNTLSITVPTGAVLNITSSDESVATVDAQGMVTGVAAGSATITASITVNGYTLVSDSCTVTVEHSFGTDWKSDGTGHWHVCSECSCKSDVEAHTYGEWQETKAATETTVGEKQRTCSVCGYVDTAEIPALGHTYGTEWKSDETNHWHECACGDKADVAAHTFGDWTVTKEATETEKGAKERTCSVCGYKETEEIPVVVVDIETQIVQNPLTDVPEELKATEFNTVEAITAELTRVAVTNAGYTAENTVVSDVKLQISTDGGKNWVDATEENFPEGGITVTLKYPTGTGKDTHDFVVTHMFAVTSTRLNTKAGDTETPAVTKTDDGIVVTLKGLSPVSISWKEIAKAPAPEESPAASNAPTATPAPTPKAPPTGDNANIGLWAALLAVCALGAAAVLVLGRKRQSR